MNRVYCPKCGYANPFPLLATEYTSMHFKCSNCEAKWYMENEGLLDV